MPLALEEIAEPGLEEVFLAGLLLSVEPGRELVEALFCPDLIVEQQRPVAD